MSIFQKLIKKPANNTTPKTYISSKNYNGVPIEIDRFIEESKKHLEEDYAVLEKEGVESIIRRRFLPWFITDKFKDRDENLIFEGLKIDSIVYCYSLYVDRFSPTNKSEQIGRFDFFFTSGNDYVSDMMESVSMQVYVLHGQIVKVDGNEV